MLTVLPLLDQTQNHSYSLTIIITSEHLVCVCVCVRACVRARMLGGGVYHCMGWIMLRLAEQFLRLVSLLLHRHMMHQMGYCLSRMGVSYKSASNWIRISMDKSCHTREADISFTDLIIWHRMLPAIFLDKFLSNSLVNSYLLLRLKNLQNYWFTYAKTR